MFRPTGQPLFEVGGRSPSRIYIIITTTSIMTRREPIKYLQLMIDSHRASLFRIAGIAEPSTFTAEAGVATEGQVRGSAPCDGCPLHGKLVMTSQRKILG